MNLTVMSWNIWSGKNWRHIIDVVKKHNIEVMGFQEVDNNLERTGFLDITGTIASSLGYYHAYSPSIENQKTGALAGGQFGNCVISKFPIIEATRHFLSTPEEWTGTAMTQPRTLLETKIKVNDTVICFMTLHLGYSKECRTTGIKLKQTEKVIAVVRNNKHFPIILSGDFNSLPESEEISTIKQLLKDVDRNNSLKTWTMYDFEYQDWKVPAGLNYKIDYIFVSDTIEHESPRIDVGKISDHVPVIVTLALE